MHTYANAAKGEPKSQSKTIMTLGGIANFKAEMEARMRAGVARRSRVGKDAQDLMDKIANYWASEGYLPPVMWVENDSNRPDMPSFIRSSMIGGRPSMKAKP